MKNDYEHDDDEAIEQSDDSKEESAFNLEHISDEIGIDKPGWKSWLDELYGAAGYEMAEKYDAGYEMGEMSKDEKIPADNDWTVREEWEGLNKNAKRKVETGIPIFGGTVTTSTRNIQRLDVKCNVTHLAQYLLEKNQAIC
ncbi:unnamed protein product [Spodoptera exigua]|nr:unnamed protein product [Spodoptera exigua]